MQSGCFRKGAPADVLHLWQDLVFPNIEASKLVHHVLFELCQLPHTLLIRGQGCKVLCLEIARAKRAQRLCKVWSQDLDFENHLSGSSLESSGLGNYLFDALRVFSVLLDRVVT
jgi:hypothetical protein